MRILANYSMKTHNESFTVTFESIGDTPREKADAAVDELFQLARTAVERQIASHNGHDKNGNGNLRFLFKDPHAPLSPRQRGMIIYLAGERGKFIEGLDKLTMQQASDMIVELLSVEA